MFQELHGQLKDATFSRCNVVGQDLNRAWAETNKFLHSEILEVASVPICLYAL